jgi:hypothetical protein
MADDARVLRWQITCTDDGCDPPKLPGPDRSIVVPKGFAWAVVAILMVVAFCIGKASDRDETIVTVVVSSAEHEMQEGYFSLGDSATMVAKPGSDLFRFLSRQRGHRIKISMTEDGPPTLTRFSRDVKQ